MVRMAHKELETITDLLEASFHMQYSARSSIPGAQSLTRSDASARPAFECGQDTTDIQPASSNKRDTCDQVDICHHEGGVEQIGG
jgi:hypothetical protein